MTVGSCSVIGVETSGCAATGAGASSNGRGCVGGVAKASSGGGVTIGGAIGETALSTSTGKLGFTSLAAGGVATLACAAFARSSFCVLVIKLILIFFMPEVNLSMSSPDAADGLGFLCGA